MIEAAKILTKRILKNDAKRNSKYKKIAFGIGTAKDLRTRNFVKFGHAFTGAYSKTDREEEE